MRLRQLDKEKRAEVELIQLFQEKKEDDQFKEIYRRYYKMVFNYFKRYVYYLPDQILEELSDDVFMKIYENINTLKDVYSFKRWVFQIAHNIAVNHLRKKKKRYVSEKHLETVEDDRINIEEKYLKKELEDILYREISRLNDKEREIIVLKYFQNLTFEEISDIIKMSVPKLKYKLKKSLVLMHRRISVQGY